MVCICEHAVGWSKDIIFFSMSLTSFLIRENIKVFTYLSRIFAMKVSARNDFSLISKHDLLGIKLRTFYHWQNFLRFLAARKLEREQKITTEHEGAGALASIWTAPECGKSFSIRTRTLTIQYVRLRVCRRFVEFHCNSICNYDWRLILTNNRVRLLGIMWWKKDTGLSVALFISVVITSCTKSMVSFTTPWT